jgi:hypothetical protein
VNLEMEMPGSTIRRGPFMVVKQMNPDRPVRRNVIPDGRGIFKTRINEFEGPCDRLCSSALRWSESGKANYDRQYEQDSGQITSHQEE